MAYEYEVGGRKHRFEASGPVSPVCHLRSFHPQDDHYGLSPASGGGAGGGRAQRGSRWSKGLLDNAARPSGAIVWRGVDGQGQS